MKAVNVRGGTGFPLTQEQKGKGEGEDVGGISKGGHSADPYGGYGERAGSTYGKGYGSPPKGVYVDYGYAKGYDSSKGKSVGKGKGAQTDNGNVDPNAPHGSLSGTVKSYSVFKAFGFIHAEPGDP